MTAEALERAISLLRDTPIIDGHNDLAWEMRELAGYDLDRIDLTRDQSGTLHTDLVRLRVGGVGAQFWSVFVPCRLTGDRAVSATLEQIDFIRAFTERYPDQLSLARGADDVEAAREQGRIASLMGAEGGHSINCSMAVLRTLHRLGVRYMTLTHSDNTPWADSATDTPVHGGLSAFGEQVVHEMNRLGMLVDISHVAPETMRAALRVSEAPVIFSHSSARALCDHPRNIPDDVLAMLPANGGIAMATFVPQFVLPAAGEWEDAMDAYCRERGIETDDHGSAAEACRAEFVAARPQPVATVSTVADHLEHMREVAGIDHIGIGGDFDGIRHTPEGLNDVAGYPNLVAELLDRGWSESDVGKLTWHNAVRVLRSAEAMAAELRRAHRPSLARIDDTGPRAAAS